MDPSSRLSRLRRRVARASRAEIHAAWRRADIRPGTVFYEAFSGNGILCNPEAIFRYLLHHPDFQHLQHIWALENPDDSAIPLEYRDHPRVRLIDRQSTNYSRYLATAEFLVNNATFPPEFSKRPGQTYINTWHGTPLKKMGYAIPDGAVGTRNIIRNFVAADYLLSSSRFMSEQMYALDYRLRNIFEGRILEEGLPRTDRQFEAGAREEARHRLIEAGIDLPEKLILYAPTWRGESFYDPSDSSAEVADVLEVLNSASADSWGAIAKVHQVVFDVSKGSLALRDQLVPNEIPTNLVLAATDLLVTDYSSIFMDFTALDRPIVFFLPDQDSYEGSRGLYVSPSELPGTRTHDLSELAGTIARETSTAPNNDDDFAESRRIWAETYAPYDDGAVTGRVVDAIFRSDSTARELDISDDGRERLLIYLGTMKPNGITTSALNMLASIDHTRFDVSVYYLFTSKPDQARNIAAIDPHVRHFPRIGGMSGSKITHARRDRLQRRGLQESASGDESIPLARLFTDEWTRCFGDSQFDYIVDFSGYGPLWDFILLQGPAQSRSVWLHNDMHADARREVHGKQHLFRKLHSVFTTYRFFDNLVSVSEELARVNSTNLSEYAPQESFTYAHNTIDYRHILRRAQEPMEQGSEPNEWRWRPNRPGEKTFVAVGRLSTEKNHERLIRAFGKVHAKDAQTRLIILGTGPLAEHLDQLTQDLGLVDAVELAGFQPNPYPAMAGADCFVLSSDHEGQPMVILEALVLGLPVVATDFSSSASAMPEGTGLIVPRSMDGVESGLAAFLAGEIPNPPFDPVAYNQRAVAEFYQAIGAGPDPT